MSLITKRLIELGLELPTPARPVASYVPWLISGKLIYVSGQLPFSKGKLVCTGQLGGGVKLEDAVLAAEMCAMNILAHLQEACGGDLDRINRIVKLTGYVSCTADFTDQPKVINGASDVMQRLFGDKGVHTRAAVGVAALPMGAAVEIEAIAEMT